MAKSEAATVDDYLAGLPPDRNEAISAVRAVILKHLPLGYEETMQYGMIGYVIPLERYPVTYNGQPLEYAALASQKHYMALYLMNVYGNREIERWFTNQYQASGKKLDMGKSCVRFKKIEDVPLNVIGQVIKRVPVKKYIEHYESVTIHLGVLGGVETAFRMFHFPL